MRVDFTGEAIVTVGLARDASRGKVLGRQHAASGHDAHEGVESGLVRVLV